MSIFGVYSFIHSLGMNQNMFIAYGIWKDFQVKAIANNATMNILVNVFWGTRRMHLFWVCD